MASSACAKALIALAALVIVAGCAGTPKTPGEPTQPAPAVTLSEQQRQRFETATAHMRAGEWDRAAGAWRALLEDGVDTAAVHANLGTTEMARNNHDAARAALEAAVKHDPTLAKAHTRLGVLYRRAGRFDRAEAAYNAALDADTDHRYAHLNLGILYDVYLGEPQRALPHYKRFQTLAPEQDQEVALWIADLERRLQSR